MRTLRRAAAIAAVLGGAAAAGIGWLALRPNAAQVDPRLGLESWIVVADGKHNSNTDMIAWRDGFLLVHDARPYHLGTPRSRLVVRYSKDARSWRTLAELRVEGKDIRDPKLLELGATLFLYALPNSGVMATPEGTLLATSENGEQWSAFEPVGPPGYLFWRPKTRDGSTYYTAAYWHEHGESILLRSRDGRAWERVSTIHRGEANDETAIEFLPDGRLLATCRLEVAPDSPFGHADASTFLAVSEPPYTRWQGVRSRVTRLDGPALFRHGERIYAVARHQPGPRRPWTRLGSAFSRKRTSLFLVEEERLVHLSDLPSAGDTSYAGVVLRDGALYADYYTSDVRRDVPWILGMFLRSNIRMARVPLDRLDALASTQQ